MTFYCARDRELMTCPPCWNREDEDDHDPDLDWGRWENENDEEEENQ